MLDIAQLRRDLPGVIARLERRQKPQQYLDVARFGALEAERKRLVDALTASVRKTATSAG